MQNQFFELLQKLQQQICKLYILNNMHAKKKKNIFLKGNSFFLLMLPLFTNIYFKKKHAMP